MDLTESEGRGGQLSRQRLFCFSPTTTANHHFGARCPPTRGSHIYEHVATINNSQSRKMHNGADKSLATFCIASRRLAFLKLLKVWQSEQHIFLLPLPYRIESLSVSFSHCTVRLQLTQLCVSCIDITLCLLLKSSFPVLHSPTGWHTNALTEALPIKTRLPR